MLIQAYFRHIYTCTQLSLFNAQCRTRGYQINVNNILLCPKWSLSMQLARVGVTTEPCITATTWGMANLCAYALNGIHNIHAEGFAFHYSISGRDVYHSHPFNHSKNTIWPRFLAYSAVLLASHHNFWIRMHTNHIHSCAYPFILFLTLIHIHTHLSCFLWLQGSTPFQCCPSILHIQISYPYLLHCIDGLDLHKGCKCNFRWQRNWVMTKCA